jgi:predicted PurR-regulated permease PerM
MAFSLDQFYRSNRRVLIWLVLLGLLWLMRDFFGLVFLTFVLAFFAAPAAGWLQRRLRLSHWLSLTLVYLLFLLALGSFVRYVTPTVIAEAGRLVNNLVTIEHRLLELNRQFAARYPGLQQPTLGLMRSWLDESARAELRQEIEARAQLQGLDPAVLTQRAQWLALPPERRAQVEALAAYEEERMLDHLIRSQGRLVRERVPQAVNLLYQGVATIGLALLFSFLILVDRNRLTRQVEALRNSRIRDFYDEAARPVARFALVVGRGLQAQAMIAVVNTVLTVLGLLLLQIPSVAMLALIVFVCSFIPVLGVFISTVPIVLVALNAAGPGLALAAVVMIVVVHAVEAYLLNPLIYGQHLKLNPVLSLIILFVGYHGFGVWGMLLGVPVARYFLSDVLQVADTPPDRRAA